MNTIPYCRLTFAVLFAVSAPTTMWAQAEEATATPAGVQWEVTSQPSMIMNGMTIPMPAQTMKVCAPLNPTEPPGSSNNEQGCVGSNFARDGLKVSWTSVCTGPPEMTGLGELTYETDAFEAYSGVITYTVEGGTMVIALNGNRIETCDNPISQ